MVLGSQKFIVSDHKYFMGYFQANFFIIYKTLVANPVHPGSDLDLDLLDLDLQVQVQVQSKVGPNLEVRFEVQEK